jgi:hypothetical protein
MPCWLKWPLSSQWNFSAVELRPFEVLIWAICGLALFLCCRVCWHWHLLTYEDNTSPAYARWPGLHPALRLLGSTWRGRLWTAPEPKAVQEWTSPEWGEAVMVDCRVWLQHTHSPYIRHELWRIVIWTSRPTSSINYSCFDHGWMGICECDLLILGSRWGLNEQVYSELRQSQILSKSEG